MAPEAKAVELITQFGDDAKYVVLEIKDNLHWLEDSINYDKAFTFWSKVKEVIEKKSKYVEIDISKENSFTHKC